MILTLITVGKMLEARSKGKTTDALKKPHEARAQNGDGCKRRQGRDRPHRAGAVRDTFVVRPGESIPVDGVVLDGTSAVNEAALTGETSRRTKPRRYGLCRNGQPVGLSDLPRHARRADTTLSQIIQMVSDAAATKAPIAKIADKVSGILSPRSFRLQLLRRLSGC